jgi:hypothetical protein
MAAIGAAAGLTLGFAVGWWIWPVQYTDTTPEVLRQDYYDDYVVMVATTYEVERDLQRARERLEVLTSENPATPVLELAQRLVESNGNTADIAHLAHLALALEGTLSPSLTPYLEHGP